ncbi:hypothetical protein C0J50_3789 [Silurus asotus]|uniref:Shieldin complex subunit 3 n=1 Tax=Silurus asotus TaxID=30991 RepID=A0AAD5FFJ1_SILAS|nr:hypothetical protein C0J50_3789 [Silurus asotus]
MDVCLHYRSDQKKSSDLVSICEKALEDFPRRVLPSFTPWFPSTNDRNCALKPKKSPPLITLNQQEWFGNAPHQPDVFSSNRCLDDQEKSVNTSKRKSISFPVNVDTHFKADSENVAKRYKRTWCVFPPKTKTPQKTQELSKEFHKTVQKYGLDLHQRAKWIISELNCAPQSIEEVWSKLSHAVKHSRLPTCNANYQRDLIQIWVYCDITYCEYIGKFLQENFQLSGELTLAVHKLGDIFKL